MRERERHSVAGGGEGMKLRRGGVGREVFFASAREGGVISRVENKRGRGTGVSLFNFSLTGREGGKEREHYCEMAERKRKSWISSSRSWLGGRGGWCGEGVGGREDDVEMELASESGWELESAMVVMEFGWSVCFVPVY